jgi:two-component system, OmpR family, response regulator
MVAGMPLKVLCVDDNRDAATSLAALLRLHGLDARCTFDGLDGWRIAGRFRPDVCVLDVNLPGLDGCELARRLREEFGSGVLLVALADGGTEYADRVDDAGFDWLFTKPTTPAALLDVFGEFASGRGLSRAAV